MSWPVWIDSQINRLKWPAAGLTAVATPLFIWALVKLFVRVAGSPWSLFPFVIGTTLFMVLWRRVLGRSRLGRFLITLEHESTHALFALLSGHRIIGFRASLGRGGEVRFTGRGNWLIAASPYFFPTAALILFLAAYLLPFPGLRWQSLLLGVALGYHIVSTYRETHLAQTDLQHLGVVFCWLFLPAANIAVVGLLVSFAHAGLGGTSLWYGDVIEPLILLLGWLNN